MTGDTLLRLFLSRYRRQDRLQGRRGLTALARRLFRRFRRASRFSTTKARNFNTRQYLSRARVATSLTRLRRHVRSSSLTTPSTTTNSFITGLFVRHRTRNFVSVTLTIARVSPVRGLNFQQRFNNSLIFLTTRRGQFSSHHRILRPLTITIFLGQHTMITDRNFAITRPTKRRRIGLQPRLARIVFRQHTKRTRALTHLRVANDLYNFTRQILSILHFIRSRRTPSLHLRGLRVTQRRHMNNRCRVMFNRIIRIFLPHHTIRHRSFRL